MTSGMAILLALLCSITYGAGDFFGGTAARRVHPFAVGWSAHSIVLVPIALAAALVGASHVARKDVGWGALGGLLGAAALLALYAGLARGPMSIVAPTTALMAASVPVVVGSVFQHERPSMWQWIGIGLALVAIGVISISPGGDTDQASTNPGFNTTTFGLALIAGIGFGMFFVALDQTSSSAGLWPLVAGRAASTVVFSVLVLTVTPLRRLVVTSAIRINIATIMASAFLDLIANVFYLFATRRGALSIVAVLSSLYPASTIVLANRIHREVLTRFQLAGLGIAGIAVAFVAAG